MATSYTSITDIQQDPGYPATNKTYKGSTVVLGPFSPPTPPSGSVNSYEPIIITEEKSPPNSNGSWSQIRRSGAIVMSPYFHRKTIERNYLGRCFNQSWFVRNWYWTDNSVNPPVCAMSDIIKLRSQWTEQGDSRYWSTVKGLVPISINDLDGDVADAVATSQSSVMAAFFGGFDALTQSAESREALSYFKSKNDEARSLFASLFGDANAETRRRITDHGNLQDLLRDSDRSVRKWGQRWMEYRYAIMPLVYAYKDIKDLYEQSGRTYQTFKSKERVSASPEWPSSLPMLSLEARTSGTVDVTSTIVAGYAPSGFSSYVSSQLQTNVFATAWELVPLSFVLDWFVNVGDFIVAKTSIDLSLQMKACTAVRRRLLYEEVLRDNRDVSLSFNSDVTGVCRPNGTHLLESRKNSSQDVIKTVEYDHYDRVLFEPKDVRLSMYNDPLGNWRRLVDASVLSYRPLKSLLRRF